MTKQERARFVQKILNKFFPHPEVSLHHQDPYTLLIATLLSAQCTDARVNQITPLLFKKAPTPQKMVKLTIPAIKALIHSCGLSNSKAKAIWHLSKQLIKDHGGKVPHTFEELEELPGVGHKTASVVLSQALNIPAFPVDTHIHRCAKRWKLSSGKNVTQTEKDLKKLFPKRSWTKLHLQMIYFARTYCTARGHEPSTCPICSLKSLK